MRKIAARETQAISAVRARFALDQTRGSGCSEIAGAKLNCFLEATLSSELSKMLTLFSAASIRYGW